MSNLLMNVQKYKIPILLFGSFLVFYTILIPFYTSKPDVIVFALRSLAANPIFDIAYLDSNTFLYGEPLPNYHLGHTLVLWLIYKLFPQSIAATIWPAGFVSAISGSLTVVLTFLISKKLGRKTKEAVIISIIVGLIPSFLEEAIIGEVYSIQFLFILLFIYSFLIDKVIWSTFFFLFANLISPLSGLSFGLLFLQNSDKKTLIKAIGIGFFALASYLLIYQIIDTNLLKLLNPPSEVQVSRGLIYRLLALIIFIVFNFNFFIIYLVKSIEHSFSNRDKIIKRLFIFTSPQLILLFAGATFFIELGSFQLPIFWALAFPLGIYISNKNLRTPIIWILLCASLIFSYSVWVLPNSVVGSAREEAGIWLEQNDYNDISVIAPWSVGISILKGRDGSSLDSLNKYYINKPRPLDADLLKTKKERLIIAEAKKMPYRIVLSKLNIPGLKLNPYNPLEELKLGQTKKIFENDYVSLFEWGM